MDFHQLAERAIGKVDFPDEYRGRLLRPLVLQAMAKMAEAIAKIDKTPQQSLLAEVGTQLADLLDQRFLLTSLTKYFEQKKQLDQSYRQSMQALLASAGSAEQALLVVMQGNIVLQQAIALEINKFVANINLMASRLAHDLECIAQEFFNKEPSVSQKPTGIIAIKITGRFAFNGGQRVAVLTLDNHKRLVYKPRDIRIEAKLVGQVSSQSDKLKAKGDAGRSFIEIINRLLRAQYAESIKPLPTYKFLPCKDEQGAYGYVDYLSAASAADVCLTHTEAQLFYRQLGQLTGISLLLGLYDLLPSNLRVSGKQIYLTDVDIAFEASVLKQFQQEISNSDAIAVPPVSVQKSLLTHFWQHSLNNTKPTTLFVVKNDRLIRNPRLSLPNNNLKVVATENFVVVHDKGSNRNLSANTKLPNIHSLYAVEVRKGITDIFSLISNNGKAALRITKFINALGGLPVRYFPFLVLAPLLQKIYTDFLHDYPEPHKFFAKINTEINKILQKKRADKVNFTEACDVTIALQAVIFESLTNGDYVYITQKLGGEQLYFKGLPIIKTAKKPDIKSDCTDQSSLGTAQVTIAKLAQPSVQQRIEVFADQYEKYIAALVMPPLPPDYALSEFVDAIGAELATQLMHKGG